MGAVSTEILSRAVAEDILEHFLSLVCLPERCCEAELLQPARGSCLHSSHTRSLWAVLRLCLLLCCGKAVPSSHVCGPSLLGPAFE